MTLATGWAMINRLDIGKLGNSIIPVRKGLKRSPRKMESMNV